MSNTRYLAHLIPDTSDNISHAQDAYTRRLNYDKQKRHERYLHDRDAGKTGFKGVRARTHNPYGNYASLYYNPVKAAEYYRTHKAQFTKSKAQNKKEPKQTQEVVEEVPVDDGGGGGGSGGGGDGGAAQAIADQLRKLQEDSAFETAAQRQATKMKIDQLRESLQQELEKKKKEREKVAEDSKNKQKELKEKAEKDKTEAKDKKEDRITKSEEALKKKKNSIVDPIREKNAELRGRLDSMGKNANKNVRAKLARQLAKNNEKINKANADYTNSLSVTKTKHTNAMRASVDHIRENLYEAQLANTNDRITKMNTIRTEIAELRNNNRNEIQKARTALNEWIANEKERVARESARIRGVEYKDNKAEQAAYQKRVEARAKQILGSSKSSSNSSNKTVSYNASGSKTSSSSKTTNTNSNTYKSTVSRKK